MVDIGLVLVGGGLQKRRQERIAFLGPQCIGEVQLDGVGLLVCLKFRLEFSEEGSKLLLIRAKAQDLRHLLLRITACACVQHGQAGGDAVRREEQIARVGRQLAIEVQGERGVASHDGLDLSGSNHGRRNEGESQKSK